MPLHEPSAGSSTGVPTPPCPHCHHEAASPVQVHDVAVGVQYWSCGACGSVWATDDQQGPLQIDVL